MVGPYGAGGDSPGRGLHFAGRTERRSCRDVEVHARTGRHQSPANRGHENCNRDADDDQRKPEEQGLHDQRRQDAPSRFHELTIVAELAVRSAARLLLSRDSDTLAEAPATARIARALAIGEHLLHLGKGGALRAPPATRTAGARSARVLAQRPRPATGTAKTSERSTSSQSPTNNGLRPSQRRQGRVRSGWCEHVDPRR